MYVVGHNIAPQAHCCQGHYAIVTIIVVIVVLFSHYERRIVHALRPMAEWIRE
jgi:hypothetical protein